MVANLVFQDPRYDFIFCFTDTTIPLDSYVTINGTPVQISKVYTAENGWNPGVGNANQGVIGFDFTGTGFTFGDTFNVTNGSYTLPVSSYAASAGYGYLNFTADRTNAGDYYPGSSIYAEQNYLNVGTGDFTIEFIANLTTTENFQTFVSFEGAGSFPDCVKFSIVLQFGDIQVYSPAFSNYTLGGNLQVNTWNHIAVVRSSGVISLYIDGALQGTQNWTYDYSDITRLRFGSVDVQGFLSLNYIFGLSGSMCNIRITANEALYTENFAPVTLPLTSGANTTVLMLAESEANKYVNSIDNVVFTNVSNPATGVPVTYSAGPIPFPPPPPPPPSYDVFWTPDTETITWCSGYDSGSCNYSISVFDFNNSIDITQVRSFNISNINSLTGLEFIVNLESFNINSFDNTFTSFDVSTGPSSLSSVFINAYYLTSITGLTSLSNLRELDVHDCSISNIDVTQLTGLTLLSIYNQHAPLTNLTLSANTALLTLNAGNNALTSIDISYNTSLTYLGVGNQPMQTYNTNFSASGIDISNNPLLTTVDVQSCNLTPSQVDSIIINLNNFGLSSGILNYSGNSGRTSASDAAYASLQSKFWSIFS